MSVEIGGGSGTSTPIDSAILLGTTYSGCAIGLGCAGGVGARYINPALSYNLDGPVLTFLVQNAAGNGGGVATFTYNRLSTVAAGGGAACK